MHTCGDRRLRKVALRLGHANLQNKEAYLRADLAEKLAVLTAHVALLIRQGKFQPPPMNC